MWWMIVLIGLAVLTVVSILFLCFVWELFKEMVSREEKDDSCPLMTYEELVLSGRREQPSDLD